MQDIKTFYLMGKTTTEMLTAMGEEPFAVLSRNGRDIYMFTGLNIEVEEGFVVKVGATPDRRGHIRIRPQRIKRAYVRVADQRYEGVIIDISARAVAIRITREDLPRPGDPVSLCTNLRTRLTTRTHVVLAGHVYRVRQSDKIVVIKFYIPFEMQSYRVLRDYLHTQQAISAMGKNIQLPAPVEGDDVIIKSDICAMCREGSCGLMHDAWRHPNVDLPGAADAR